MANATAKTYDRALREEVAYQRRSVQAARLNYDRSLDSAYLWVEFNHKRILHALFAVRRAALGRQSHG